MDVISKLTSMLLWGLRLNFLLFLPWLRGDRILIFQLNAPRQLMHIEPVLQEIKRRQWGSVFFVILINPPFIKEVSDYPELMGTRHVVSSIYSASILLLWHAVVAVDQTMRFPILRMGRPIICMFHGQPSKGNSYLNFSYRSINHLFLYGPLMRDYYRREKSRNAHWPNIEEHEIGQPKSDVLFNNSLDCRQIAARWGLDPIKKTVLFAPSFEPCSALQTNGRDIIEYLIKKDVNLIIRPHPATYTRSDSRDWPQLLDDYARQPNCLHDRSPDILNALVACDMMLTDYSGVAFEAIALDKPVIFWDCPDFFFSYAPAKYGADSQEILKDIACNGGREAGRVVSSLDELGDAITEYASDPRRDHGRRMKVADQLFFNRGAASAGFVHALEKLLVKRPSALAKQAYQEEDLRR